MDPHHQPFTDAGLSAIRTTSWRTSHDQRAPPHAQHAYVIWAVAPDHRIYLEKLLRRFCFRPAPVASRIGGMDRRAQRRPRHVLLDRDALELCVLRATPFAPEVSAGDALAHLRSPLKAHRRHSTLCFAPFGSLAAEANQFDGGQNRGCVASRA